MTIGLINISGEPREFEEGGFIYEFPFPSDVPTSVPDDVAKKLMTTHHYKEVSQKAKEKENKSLGQYRQELIDLPRIGEKKAEDIISVYSTRKEMVEAAKNKDNLPWDADIDKVLKEHFGGN